MKRIIIVALLSIFAIAPAVAVEGKNSVGVNYGVDAGGVFGIQGEFDISSMVNKVPISVQVFWKGYSRTYSVPVIGSYKYSYTALGAAAIYDFSSELKLDKKIKPYAGVGLYNLSASLSSGTAGFAAADSGGVYFTGGARYALTPQLSADLNYNNIGGITIGANFNF
jgi:hypothetical protein